MNIYNKSPSPNSFDIISSLDENLRKKLESLVAELLTKSRVKLAHLRKTEFSDYFRQIQNRFCTTSARQIIYHAVNPYVPKCHCGNEVEWYEKSYRQCCSVKCVNNDPVIRQKREETCIQNYGVTVPARSLIVQKKMKDTLLEKYGVDHNSKIPDVKTKKKETNMNRYGVEYTLSTDQVKTQSKKTKLERYGNENYTNPEKRRETNIEKYGVENTFQHSVFQQKTKDVLLEKYGVDSYSKTEMFIKQSRETCVARYGVDNPSKNEKVKQKSKETSIKNFGAPHHKQKNYSQEALDFLSNDALFTKLLSENSMQKVANMYGLCSTQPIYHKMKRLGLKPIYQGTSIPEKEIADFVKLHYAGEVIENDRKTIGPKELDVYLPELKFAIEHNGSYTHTELNGKSEHYHNTKTKLCAELGISLFHVWQHEWEHKQDIVKSMILNKLGKSEKLYARKCKVFEVTSKEANVFFKDNHLQGKCNASVRLGLYHDNVLVSCMTFAKPRYNKKAQWELVRFVSKKGMTVVGGASKLFAEFIRNHNPESVISYAARMHSTGKVYMNLGFVHTGTSSPGYQYTDDFVHFYHRSTFQKHKLSSLGLMFDPAITEWENMQANDYDRIWDCGNDVFFWTNPSSSA